MSSCRIGLVYLVAIGVFACFGLFADPVAVGLIQMSPQPLRVIEVSSDEELDVAIKEALPGDRIQIANGFYQGLRLQGLRGSEDAPIVFAAQRPRMAIINGARSGRNLILSNCNHLEFHGIRFTEGPVWGVTVGPKERGNEDQGTCRYIRFINCEFDHAGQELLKVSGGSSHVSVIGCSFHHSGMRRDVKPAYAEGIYIGEGATQDDRSHDIVIMSNHFHSIGNEHHGGEAIDIKRKVYRVQIIDNTIEDVIVHSGGAITVLVDPVDYPQSATNPEVTVTGNRIRNVRKLEQGWTGGGICIGANGVLVTGNYVEGTEGPAFLVYSNAANTSGVLGVYHNHFYGDVVINEFGLRNSKDPVSVDFLYNSMLTEEAVDGDD